MKRFTALLLCIMIAAGTLCLSGCFQFISSLSDYSSYPALWIIEDKEGHRCYLFGTNNTGKGDGDFPLPDIIEDAYSYCGAIAVEFDFTAKDAYEPVKYTDGTSIKSHLSERVYNAAAARIEAQEGGYNGQYDDYHVSEWYAMLENYACKTYGYSTEYGTDRYIINKAKTDGKKIYELESAGYQTNLTQSISDRVYEYFITTVLNSRGSTSYDYYDQLYRSGDMTSLARAVDSGKNATYSDAELKAQMDSYYDLMFTQRNKALAEKIMQFLSDGERVFVAVSCTHAVGEDGIISVLQSNGYKVIRK